MTASRIGCAGLVYALLTADTGSEAPTWGTPVPCLGVKSVSIAASTTTDTNFWDDGPAEVATSLGDIEVGIVKNALSTAEKAALLGHNIDTKGALSYGAGDTPPWVAIGFKTLKSNGQYRYVWLYKGKFAEPEDKSETKGDSINYQDEEIKGKFVKLDWEYEVALTGGTTWNKIHPWKYEIDAEAPDADAAIIAAWFTAVTTPPVKVA